MDLNAKEKYRLIELETKTDTEEIEEYESPYLTLAKGIIKANLKVLKFSLYLCIGFLELIIKLIKVLFNLTDYKPFKTITESKNSFLNNIAYDNINKEKVKFASDFMCRHEYSFPRSDTFLNCYKEIQQRLKNISDNNIELNNALYRDTIKQINVLIVEAEKQALKQGYGYAKESKYKLDITDAYDSYIENKIMQGESNRKFKIED